MIVVDGELAPRRTCNNVQNCVWIELLTKGLFVTELSGRYPNSRTRALIGHVYDSCGRA